MFRSKEFKIVFLSVLFTSMACLIMTYFYFNVYFKEVSKSVSKQNMAIVGEILKNHPELEEEVVPVMTKEIDREALEIGRKVLNKYDYTDELEVRNQIAITLITNKAMLRVMIIILAFSTFSLVAFCLYSFYLSYRIKRLVIASEKVIDGDLRVRLVEQGEGYLSLLNHQFNKMTGIIKNNYDILNKEKIFLKDTISDISHQLKTPLASLVMFNDLLLENEDMPLETRREFLEKSRLQYDRIEWLIVNLLKIARIEAGAISFKKEVTKLLDVVKKSKAQIEGKLLEFDQKIEIEGDLEAVFLGDEDWTEEAVSNIMKNATEHAPKSSTIRVKIVETPSVSSIYIRNKGEKIKDKDINMIFRRFYRSSASKDSVGIGLNLTKSIVEGQGGTVSCQNEVDGVSFVISFMNPKRKDSWG